SATTDGKTSKSIASIEIADYVAPVVTGIILTPSQYGYIRGQEFGLSYEIGVPNDAYPVSDCVAAVTVQKGTLYDGDYTYEDMTEGTDYTYDSDSKKLTFPTVGYYKITVSATSETHDVTGSSFVTVNVGDFAQPSFTFKLASDEVEEGGTVTFTTSEISYDTGDGAAEGGGELQYSVRYKVRASASWEDSSEDGKWTITENVFTAKSAGYYEVTAYVESALGTIGRQVAVLYAAPKEITVTPSAAYTGEWMHVAKNASLTLDYTVSDSELAENSYDLAVQADEGFTVNGTNVTAEFSELGTYTATITYTHKVDTQYKKVVVYKLSVVNDVDNAPKFVGDPFNGTFDTLV
ncbi:MAG: hypothetical protein K2N74_06090, partial [Clostridiales bacterium]|nr:hypothetical protein [Clostridiales bacterium]